MLIHLATGRWFVRCSSCVGVLTQKWWDYDRLNDWTAMQITFTFNPFFYPYWSLLHCNCNPFIKSIEFYLFRYKCWLIIDISYNLSKYIQYEHVRKLFEEVWLHQNTVTALCRLDGNEICTKYLRILVAIVHIFFDWNRISKTVYCIWWLVSQFGSRRQFWIFEDISCYP